MLCAVILQMVQGCVQLPPADADPRTVVQAYGHAVKSADYFWAKCLDRLPAARAHKVETDLDFAAVCAGLVQDLLTAVLLPQWPAASTLLLRLAAALNSQKGLQHQDPAVRQMCLDLLGKMLAHLHGAEVALKGDADWLADVAATNEFDDVATAAPQLLLTYLADRQRSGTSSAAAARRFWLVRLLCEEAAGVLPRDSQSEVPHEAEEQVRGMVLAARKKAEQLEVLTYDTGLDPKDACRLMRTAVHTDFDRAAPAMLSWLLEMMDPRGQAPGTRSKAVKALADVVAVNKEVLNLATVQASVDRSLHDDSISVREAALGLLGRHMAADPELTLRLLDTVITAVEGTTRCLLHTLTPDCPSFILD